jgi:hypothetical protein
LITIHLLQIESIIQREFFTVKADPVAIAIDGVIQSEIMIISFRGRGWLVGVITAGCLLASDFLTSVKFHDANYYAQHGWPKLVAFWVAAGIVQWMVPRGEDEVLAGTQEFERQKRVLRERDSFLLFPVKYWPIVLIVLGIGFYFVRV